MLPDASNLIHDPLVAEDARRAAQSKAMSASGSRSPSAASAAAQASSVADWTEAASPRMNHARPPCGTSAIIVSERSSKSAPATNRTAC